MPFKNLLAIVGSEKADAHTLAFAEALAAQEEAFLTELVVGWRPELPVMLEGWVVDARWGSLVAEEETRLKGRRAAVEAHFAGTGVRGEVRSEYLSVDAERRIIAAHARHADVSIIGRPESALNDTARRPLIEIALFDSGRPVILAPPGWRKGGIGKRVLVCWNGSRESARATGDAMPLLTRANEVIVVTIDAKPRADHQPPGLDIATHLGRHGIKAEAHSIDPRGRHEAKVVLDEAASIGADLIVMGGYGRSRLAETVFGGMTRDMMASATIPVLLSH